MARIENLFLYSNRFDQNVWTRIQVGAMSSQFDANAPTRRTTTWVNQPAPAGQTSVPVIAQSIATSYRINDVRYNFSVWVKNLNFATGDLRLSVRDQGTEQSTIQWTFNPVQRSSVDFFSIASPGGKAWRNPNFGVDKLEDGWARAWLEATLPDLVAPTNLIRVLLSANPNFGVGQQLLLGGMQAARTDTQTNVFVETTNTIGFGTTFDPFDFPFHTFSTTYPDNSTRVQMGKSYIFTAKPQGPPQRIFKLRFRGMRWILTSDGQRDITSLPQHNLAKMEDFYKAVQLWKSFLWTHPLEGTKVVRFNKPLEIPEQIEGGSGVVNPFDVELLEQP